MSGESVKVAVRVRPFNQREKDRQAKCIIEMTEGMTIINNPDAPNEEGKKFTFDYSYWSHDQYIEKPDGVLEATSSKKYHSQQDVFNDLGQGVLDNAFEGYNCSLFAYGQTGSGKSYSMVGYGPNRGIVPITCDELFQAISNNKDSSKRFEVTFSMLEIYNEQVRDLLSKDNPRGGLAVRQNPKLGVFYVENLKKVPVGSYEDIDARMTQGTASRTVASTNMNATSSRAHTVVTITFDQIIKKDDGSETKKSSVMNLVDLAGSERADSTGATGDRLKEGANINKSLSALGNVISALADLSMGKKKIMVPYRDSALTKLLQNALGGNSKTVMIAALSPADINYDETLSTLRYADRAKKIKNKAVINENPIEKLIRELREENDKLRIAMEGGSIQLGNTQGMSLAEIEKMKKEMEAEIRSQLMANEQQIGDSTQDWDAKLAEARAEGAASIQSRGDDTRKQKIPHLVNLNEDAMLSGVVCYFLEKDTTTIGRSDGSPKPDICLSGLSIQMQHATIKQKKGEFDIEPCGYTGSKTRLNGILLTTPSKLNHKDRILFGSNHLYVFHNPKKESSASTDLPNEITFEFAQKELAKAKGFSTGGAGLSKDQARAQEQVLEILPMVSEVNAISEELNKYKSFEVALISGAAQEVEYGKTKGTSVMVKMKNLLNGNTWMWERGKFMNRRYLIQEMYQKHLDGEDVSKILQEEDPFWEPTEDILIGTANVFLQSLSYSLDFDDRVALTDYKGQEEGFLYVNVAPSLPNGKPLADDCFVDQPEDLLNKPFHFKVNIKSADVQKARYSKGLKVRYRVYDNNEYIETKVIKNTLSPEFNHSKVFSFPVVDEKLLEFFDGGSVTMLLYGTQEDKILDTSLQKLNTRELRQNEYNQAHGMTVKAVQRKQSTIGEMGNEHSQLRSEVMVLHKKYERLAQKEKRLQQICEEWDEKPASGKDYDAFYRVISAAAFSTGTKFKTRVMAINQALKAAKAANSKSANNREPDTLSLYVFGEEEQSLGEEAQQNNGFINYEKLEKFCPPEEVPQILSRKHLMKSHNKTSRLNHSDSFSSVDLAPFLCKEDLRGDSAKRPILFKKHRSGEQSKPSIAYVKPLVPKFSPDSSTVYVPRMVNDIKEESPVPTSKSCVIL